MELEKTELSQRAFDTVTDATNFVLDRVVRVPFVMDVQPDEPEIDYEQLLLGYAEFDTRRWDVV